VSMDTGETQRLGYLVPELKAYSFFRVNQSHKVPTILANNCLTENALHILESLRENPPTK